MTGSPPPDDLLRVRAAAPDWFREALAAPARSRRVDAAGAEIHFLCWDVKESERPRAGILLAHGGGAHAYWWSFIGPLLGARGYRVAALSFSGMGDSGRRENYETAHRMAELAAVMEAAGLEHPRFLVGHSFGGLMSMKFAASRGETLSGAVFVDAPVRSPEEIRDRPFRPPRAGRKRVYPDFGAALARFRLMPEQDCANDFIVEHIGRRSIRRTDGGWTWKFDLVAMGPQRFREPFYEHLANARCRTAVIYGERSALVSADGVAYMRSLMAPGAPVIGIPDAQHHVMLDQPLAFVDALCAILDGWLD